MTKKQALGCMAVLAGSYTKHDLSQANLEAYAAMLMDLDVAEVTEAIKRLICKSKWFPAIAEIRAEVAEAKCAGLVEPELAWGEVLKAIGRWGHNRTPEWSSPVMAAAVDAVSWRSICLSTNEASTRARFLDAYKAARVRVVRQEQLGVFRAVAPRLPGAHPISELLPKIAEES